MDKHQNLYQKLDQMVNSAAARWGGIGNWRHKVWMLRANNLNLELRIKERNKNRLRNPGTRHPDLLCLPFAPIDLRFVLADWLACLLLIQLGLLVCVFYCLQPFCCFLAGWLAWLHDRWSWIERWAAFAGCMKHSVHFFAFCQLFIGYPAFLSSFLLLWLLRLVVFLFTIGLWYSFNDVDCLNRSDSGDQ